MVVANFEIMTPKVFPTKAAFVIANPKAKLLDQLREILRVKHPRDLGAADVVAFLNHLAYEESVSAGTQNQALNAISFW